MLIRILIPQTPLREAGGGGVLIAVLSLMNYPSKGLGRFE